MKNTAVFALDIQNGFITPQNQHVVFNAVHACSEAVDNSAPLIAVTSELTSDGDNSIDAFIWHLHQSEEASEPFQPLETLLAAPSPSLYVQRVGPSAWTSATTLFAKKHSITDVAIVGIDHDEVLLYTILDLQELGIQVSLIADALDANLEILPLQVRRDVRIVNAASLF